MSLVDSLIWAGIAVCVSQSAMFSGLNLAFFSLSRLRLEAEAPHTKSARRVLAMREDANFLLTTILWGNVGINVLLTLLSNSVMVGLSAFLFSTIVITIFGEIGPQAYFSRNALRMASLLSPVLRLYQFLLYPVAKPCALVLDRWLGKEAPEMLRERILKELIVRHVQDPAGGLERVEGVGALNFLHMDDVLATDEGELVSAASVITLPVQVDLPVIPPLTGDMKDPFLQRVNASGEKWVVLTDSEDNPGLLLDADGFLRAMMFQGPDVNPYDYCHRPLVIRNPETRLGYVLRRLKGRSHTGKDEVIEHDIVLVWNENEHRVITGADILGRLMEGIDRDHPMVDST